MVGPVQLARLLDRDRARAVLLQVRRDVGPTVVPEDPDPASLELVEPAYESVTDAFRRLRALEEHLRTAGDRRAVFLTVYSRMTEAILEAIEAGAFEDSDWMREYTVQFADHYRRAFLAFEQGRLGDVPNPWQVAFGTAMEESALVVQDAFLGINAHINFDLALTLREVGIDPRRGQKHADHRRVDDVLSDLIDAQQTALAELYAPGLAGIDRVFGRFDEQLSLLSMGQGRAHAWRTAVVLTDLPWSPITGACRWLLRTTSTGAAFFILEPPVDPTLHEALSAAERAVTFEDALARFAERLDKS